METLKNILAIIRQATGISPQAFETDLKSGLPAITYNFYRTVDNGAVAQYRLQTRVTAQSFTQAMGIEKKLTDALITIGDEYKANCSIQSNGGGTLIDEETNYPQVINYFDITTKH